MLKAKTFGQLSVVLIWTATRYWITTSYSKTNKVHNIKYSKTILIFVATCFGQSWPSSGEQSVHTGGHRSLYISRTRRNLQRQITILGNAKAFAASSMHRWLSWGWPRSPETCRHHINSFIVFYIAYYVDIIVMYKSVKGQSVRGGAVGWGDSATSRKVAGSIPE
jgi:hypothetical protein